MTYSTLTRKTPLKSRSKARPGAAAARRAVSARSGGWCEARLDGICTGRANRLHHVLLRSQCSTDDPELMADLCIQCHDWVHANVDAAHKLGWIVHHGPRAMYDRAIELAGRQ